MLIIETQLKPWLDLLESHSARWRRIQHPETGRMCDGIVLIWHVNVSAALEDHDLAKLRRLRELMELLRLLVIADELYLVQVMKKLCHQWTGSVDETEIIHAIMRRVPLTMTIQLRSTGVSDFTAWLSGLFSDSFASDAADFIRERQRIRELLSASQLTKLQSQRMPVSLKIDSEVMESLLCVDTEDFFVDLARFAAQAKRETETSKLDSYDSLLPIALEKISLRLPAVWITPRTLQKAMDLMATGVPVKLKSMTIDPRFVQCSQDDLHCFLKALTQVKSKLRINIGQSGRLMDYDVLDRRGQDRSETLRMIINAVNSLATIDMLDIYELLRMLVSPSNRRVVFQELLIPVLARPTPLAKLRLGSAVMTPEDSVSIRTAAQEWRNANPGKLLRVQHLLFVIMDGEFSSLDAITTMVDDAEDVAFSTMLAEDPGKLPSSTLRSVLRYPSLTALHVQDCAVESMDLFDPLIVDPDLPVKPILRTLELDDFVLDDRPSMERFLRNLGDATHPLAKKLTLLCLRGDVESTTTFTLNAVESRVLADALRNNHVVALVELNLAPIDGASGPRDRALTRQLLEDLQQTHRRSTTDQDRRQTGLQRARVLAFLSVLQSDRLSIPETCRQLDAGVLRVILDFSAPHQSRSVNATSILDFEEDNED